MKPVAKTKTQFLPMIDAQLQKIASMHLLYNHEMSSRTYSICGRLHRGMSKLKQCKTRQFSGQCLLVHLTTTRLLESSKFTSLCTRRVQGEVQGGKQDFGGW